MHCMFQHGVKYRYVQSRYYRDDPHMIYRAALKKKAQAWENGQMKTPIPRIRQAMSSRTKGIPRALNIFKSVLDETNARELGVPQFHTTDWQLRENSHKVR